MTTRDEFACARPGCGHSEAIHFDDRDGMFTDGPCERGRQTGVKCQCDGYVKPETSRKELDDADWPEWL